jgi:hypothetical protein
MLSGFFLFRTLLYIFIILNIKKFSYNFIHNDYYLFSTVTNSILITFTIYYEPSSLPGDLPNAVPSSFPSITPSVSPSDMAHLVLFLLKNRDLCPVPCQVFRRVHIALLLVLIRMTHQVLFVVRHRVRCLVSFQV